MSQHDFDIANQGFAAFRADLNNALKALGSTSSGTAEPATTYANQLWYETDTNTLHIRNEANSAWLDLMVIDQTTGSPSFTAGNVGIGTTSPASIVGGTDTSPVLSIGGTDTALVAGDKSGSLSFITNDTSYTATYADGVTGEIASISDSATGAAYGLALYTGTTTGSNRAERMRIASTGNVGIGTTDPGALLHLYGSATAGADTVLRVQNGNTDGAGFLGFGDTGDIFAGGIQYDHATDSMGFYVNNSYRMTIDSSGNVFVGTTSLSTSSSTDVGASISSGGLGSFARAGTCITVNRQTSDGTLIDMRQAGVSEGTISVSGTTVSYNGGHLSRWAQFPDNSRPELLKGTVMSNLDQMSSWGEEDNEQLNCVQVSTVEGDPNVAGVFVTWDSTDDGYNDILLAMTGDMVIRIAAGTTVQRGDLLMSAGDGTAKPQDDDIVRSKTIAKVTSTHVSHTYSDGSYAVPCVLMAC